MSSLGLSVDNLSIAYGAIAAVRSVAFTVPAGKITTLIGANGAGKTSILRALSGLLPFRGSVMLGDQSFNRLAAENAVRLGVIHVPEGRGVFPNLTVWENLKLAAWGQKDKAGVAEGMGRACALFPRLAERTRQKAGTLSGGEQQMLAIGRAVVARPKILLLDEPSMGLAPVLVREIFRVIREINSSGTTILLVEQNANMALSIADHAYVLETGQIIKSGKGPELLTDPQVRQAYLGA